MAYPLFSKQPIFEHPDQKVDPYMTRWRAGWFAVHAFWRGDADPYPHDHPWWFITFPLVTYVEEIYDPATHKLTRQIVKRFRFHYRPIGYAHRVIGPHKPNTLHDAMKGTIYTLTFHGPVKKKWGFYIQHVWTYWKDYKFGKRRK